MIAFAILLVGGALFFAEYRNDKAKVVYTAPEVITSTSSEQILPQNTDTDGDGFKDWEEILVGTDPKDPKSKESLKKKPTVVEDLTKIKTKLEPIDNISREFFARYMELRQVGLSKDKLSQEEIVSKTVGGIVLPEPKIYGLDEIYLKKDSSNESVVGYGDEISSIFKKYAIQSRNEAVITREATEKESPEILKEIDPILVSYENILKDLLKIQAPQSMSVLHLDLINSVSGVIFVTKGFRDSAIDPLKGAQAVSYYQITQQSLYDALIAIKSYFNYLGINDEIF